MQRARILSAMAQLVCEPGIHATTVARVISRAGVSRRTFYEHFEDRNDALLGVLDEAIARAGVSLARARRPDAPTGWVDRIRADLLALLEFIEDERELVGVCLVHALAGGDARLLARREHVLGTLAAAVDEGRASVRGVRPPPLTAEAAVGAVLAIVHVRLQDERRPPLAELLSPLMAIVVLPYLGPSAAQRELARPAPVLAGAPHEPDRPAPSDPLSGLNMRMTYRTLRVLSAIAAEPGLCNREVADGSGITDPGQVSRLLSRLSRLGLIENHEPGASAHTCNAWRLTETGKRVCRTTLRLPVAR